MYVYIERDDPNCSLLHLPAPKIILELKQSLNECLLIE